MKRKIVWSVGMILLLAHGSLFAMDPDMPMHSDHERNNSEKVPAQRVDPVCGLEVSTDTARVFNYNDSAYYFESEDCLKVFQKNPEKFTQASNPTDSKTDGRHSSKMMMGGAAMVLMMAAMMTIVLVAF